MTYNHKLKHTAVAKEVKGTDFKQVLYLQILMIFHWEKLRFDQE